MRAPRVRRTRGRSHARSPGGRPDLDCPRYPQRPNPGRLPTHRCNVCLPLRPARAPQAVVVPMHARLHGALSKVQLRPPARSHHHPHRNSSRLGERRGCCMPMASQAQASPCVGRRPAPAHRRDMTNPMGNCSRDRSLVPARRCRPGATESGHCAPGRVGTRLPPGDQARAHHCRTRCARSDPVPAGNGPRVGRAANGGAANYRNTSDPPGRQQRCGPWQCALWRG